ncbi:TetR/AcrR family transcriptional regulator [Rhodococcus sp. NPDC058521]|uniref:TetR/AcrR family transcriptional regulator n=1 Tax=Rhodococcus sp. NPDC058521 TaxID=3346536 RepID=UPI003666F7A2
MIVAAQDLLAEVGYDRLSMEAVAARVGASRATVYRRWKSKSELVLDAIAALRWEEEPPNTGSLRSDLIALGAVYAEQDARRDAIITGIVTAMAHDMAIRSAVEETIARPRREAFLAIVSRAQARGEVSVGTDLAFVGQVFPAMTFYQVVAQPNPVDEDFVTRVIDRLIIPLLYSADSD